MSNDRLERMAEKFGVGDYADDDPEPDRDDDGSSDSPDADATPGDKGASPGACDCRNPVCVHNTDDGERAALFAEYLARLRAEGVDVDGLRFMPVDDDTKAPIITGKTGLETRTADLFLHDAQEAYTALRNGHPGFALYAGNDRHGTDGLVFVDNDDPETFPEDDLPETLTVLSGSGGGKHYTYTNAGGVANAVASGDGCDYDGEIRASNWFVKVPGSTHDTGGIYHVTESRDVAELADDDLPDALKPATTKPTADDGETIHLEAADDVSDRDAAEFTNVDGYSLEFFRDYDDTLDALCKHLQPSAFPDDTSAADMSFVSRLWRYGFDRQGILDVWRRYRNRPKLDRPDYIPRTFRNANLREDNRSSREWADRASADYSVASVTILPENLRTHQAKTGWQYAGDETPTVGIDDLRERTKSKIDDAQSSGDWTLVNAIMSAGKTYSSIQLAAEENRPVTYLAGRDNLLAETGEIAQDHGLRVKRLPRFPEDCPTYRGEHGDYLRDVVKAAYALGASPATIHERMSDQLPCHHPEADEAHGGGGKCPYIAKWDFDPEDYDVLLGHYTAAYVPKVTVGRHVVMDEYPENSLWVERAGDDLRRDVNAWCGDHAPEGFPFRDWNDIIAHRHPTTDADADRLQDALDYFETEIFPVEPDETAALHETHHSHAPHFVYTVLFGSLGGDDYPMDRAGIRTSDTDAAVGVYAASDDHSPDKVIVQDPPELDYAASVVCLDGTGDKKAWEVATGLDLNFVSILADNERRDYLKETLNLVGVQASESKKPYSSGNWVTTDQDAALFDGVADTYGSPVVFTSKSAEAQYEHAGLLASDGGPIRAMEHFGNIRGTNKHKSERVAVVSGSPHRGDRWVRFMAAFDGETIHPEGKGNDREYGDAERYVRLMRESAVAQAAMRIGRDGDGGVVVFNTSAVPDWFPIIGTGRVVRTWTSHQRDVLSALAHLAETKREGVTVGEIYDHPDVECSRRHVQNVVHTFAEFGHVTVEKDGRELVAEDDGLHEVTDRGEVQLTPVDAETELTASDDADDEDPHRILYMPLFGVSPDADNVSGADHRGASVNVTHADRGDTAAGGGPPS